MRHFDVQLLGGIAMFHRSIAEMQTGEGKTLAATLPMYLYGLLGKGCHLATVNDYLARRDAEWMGPIYRALGMTVGVIETQMSQDRTPRAYGCDVTYGTAKEFGFDFLRDRLLLRRISEGQGDLLGGMLGHGSESSEKAVQGPALFALVDEADSILIDEARTPLIISALPTEEQKREVAAYQWARQHGRRVRRRGRLRFRLREEDRRAHAGRPAKGPRPRQSPKNWTRWAWSTCTTSSNGPCWSTASTSTTGSTSSATARS